jgi:Mn2+/Fe2+ NRAMP family transporter
MFEEFRSFLKQLGPGLITGASDDDPAGIATYAQAGAQFGTGPLWLTLLSLPGMLAVQEMCARIAIVTRKGLIENIRTSFPPWFVWIVVGLLAVANTFNIGADLGMMAASAQLVVPLPFWQWLILLSGVTILLQIFVSYARYARYLKWLTLSLFAYILVAVAIQIDWGNAIRHTFWPTIIWSREFLFIVIAFLGTTISPYLYVWQANSEVEDGRFLPSHLKHRRSLGLQERLRASFVDVVCGMGLSNVVAWFIMLTGASVLHIRGITQIETADQAARMLAPLVGQFASLVFALGIIGTGLLAVPVLSSVIAYATCEALGIREGLSKKWFQAKCFYAIIVISTIIGIFINLLQLSPVRLLLYSAVANAIIAPPLLFAILRLATDRKRLKEQIGAPWIRVVGFITLIVMTIASVLGIWLAITG